MATNQRNRKGKNFPILAGEYQFQNKSHIAPITSETELTN
jgi:hypothetical protein